MEVLLVMKKLKNIKRVSLILKELGLKRGLVWVKGVISGEVS